MVSAPVKLSVSRIDEIQQYLPDASTEQSARFEKQVLRLQDLNSFFKTFPEDVQHFQAQIERAAKALDYKRPYRIAVIGTTGAGKSTLINALLSRELVLTKSMGKPATGTVLNIFLDVPPDGQEIATVAYRKEEDIYQLLSDFKDRYALAALDLAAPLNAQFHSALLQIDPSHTITEQARPVFVDLRTALADIVMQHISREVRNCPVEYALADSRACERLSQLVDENSEINRMGATTREIGLIKSITYHIKPAQQIDGVAALKLPRNVCLVDLPGLDGPPLHDLIIAEGIREADAVIFIIRPPRILVRGDTYLLERVRRYISIEGNTESGERVFLVLNAKDSITADVDNDKALRNLPRDMEEMTNLLVPGYSEQFSHRGGNHPYFETFAWAAYAAQQRLQNKPLTDSVTYDATKLKLGLKDATDLDVLAASQVPWLVEALTKFASEQRIEGQIRDAKQTLDDIVNTLRRGYEETENSLTKNRGEFYFQEKVEQRLKIEQQALEDAISNFRGNQLERFDDWQQRLEVVVKSVCDETDKTLRARVPEIWKEASSSRRDPIKAERIVRQFWEVVLSQIQADLWEQLSKQVPRLSERLVQFYVEELTAYKMPQRIANASYGCLDVAYLQKNIDTFINQQMRRSMVQVGQRIALTAMTEPNNNFTATAADDTPIHTVLFNNLRPIVNKTSVSEAQFDALIAAVRQQYEAFVSQYCVTRLLNLYRYEMLVVEEHLLSLSRENFYKVRNSNDPVLQARISGSISDPDVKRVEQVQAKLTAIAAL
jgi:energy-coupling factor transporter ATP-binding protein EcfA2